MVDEKSKLIGFYPSGLDYTEIKCIFVEATELWIYLKSVLNATEFEMDVDGKRFLWQV